MIDTANSTAILMQSRNFPHSRKIKFMLIALSVLTVVLSCLSLAVHFHRIGVITLAWERAPVSGIHHNEGFAYNASTGHPELSSDQHPSASLLLEDGELLPGPANAQHADIRLIGMGRYSYWYDYIYFSASDNSNPLTNGRAYEIQFARPIRNSIAYALYGATALIFLLAAGFFFLWMKERIHGRWEMTGTALRSWMRGNRLATASIFAFLLSFGLTALFLITDGAGLPKSGLFSPTGLVWAGLFLMVLALAGLVRREERWTQQILQNRDLSIGLVIGSIVVSAFLLFFLLMPVSLSQGTHQSVFIGVIGTLTFLILLARRAGWIGERIRAFWQAPTTALRRVPTLMKAIDGCSSVLRYVSHSTHWTGHLLRAITLTMPFLAYAAVLGSDLPARIGLEARMGTNTGILLLFAALLFPIFRRSGWWGDLGSLAVTLVFFALPLSGLWNSGYSSNSAIGGLLPWSDASGYYADANRLLEGGMMSAFSQRRPLFPGTLAAVLGLVDGNLAIALAIFGAISILACFLLAREVRRSHGAIAGVITLAVLFLFYRTYIGLCLTENLGIALGALAMAVLWRGAGDSKKEMVWAGIFLLTMALNARAGAFFVLPMLVLWGIWYFRGNSRISLRFLFGGCAAILLGFLLDAILRRLTANSGGIAFGNFSYSLYGLVVGNKGWAQVKIDHPEILSLFDSQLYNYIYQLAFEAFRSDPMRALSGFLGAWRDFFTPNSGAFSFINLQLFGILNALDTRCALAGISGLGLLGCIRKARDPRASLLLASTFGILASVPFAPPIDSDVMRAYAATIPFVAIWVALGIYTLFQGLKWLGENHVPKEEEPALSPVIPGLVFALFCLLSPILARGLRQPTEVSRMGCPSGLVPIYFRTDRSAAVNLVSDDASLTSHLPNIRISDFTNHMYIRSYPELKDELNHLTAGKTLMQVLDMGVSGNSKAWLIVDTNSFPSSDGVFRACGNPIDNEWLQQYRFYTVETIELIRRPGK